MDLPAIANLSVSPIRASRLTTRQFIVIAARFSVQPNEACSINIICVHQLQDRIQQLLRPLDLRKQVIEQFLIQMIDTSIC